MMVYSTLLENKIGQLRKRGASFKIPAGREISGLVTWSVFDSDLARIAVNLEDCNMKYNDWTLVLHASRGD